MLRVAPSDAAVLLRRDRDERGQWWPGRCMNRRAGKSPSSPSVRRADRNALQANSSATRKGAFGRRGACNKAFVARQAPSFSRSANSPPGAPGWALRLLEAPTAGSADPRPWAAGSASSRPPTGIPARWWARQRRGLYHLNALFPIRSPAPCTSGLGRYPLLAASPSSGSIAAPAATSPQPPWGWRHGTIQATSGFRIT